MVMEFQDNLHETSNSQKTTVFDKEVCFFGRRQFDKKTVLLVMNLIIVSFIGLISVLTQPVTTSNTLEQPAPDKISRIAFVDTTHSVKVESTQELMKRLKDLNLWEISQLTEIPAVVINGFPMNFHKLHDLSLRKKVFLHTLLPAALIALAEVRQERMNLIQVLKKIDRHLTELDFSGNQPDWEKALTKNEIDFVYHLVKKYRTPRAFELLDRIDVIPVSLILGQGAIESSWGGSRFARTGNNIFGMWTWGREGIVPAEREAGKHHKVRVYNSILESVRSYILTLNRLSVYDRMRELRRQTKDSLTLAEGLLYYSEKRDGYVRDLRRVISSNNLKSFDHFILAMKQPRQQIDPLKRSDIKPTYMTRRHNDRI